MVSSIRITPPCLPGRFCDCLERLRIEEVEQFYIFYRIPVNHNAEGGTRTPTGFPTTPSRWRLFARELRSGQPPPETNQDIL
jgi:hypothetical protein